MLNALMRYGALTAKVRALYGKRLRLPDFEHMAALSAPSEVLDYLGLEDAEKTVSLCVVTDTVWRTLKRGLRQKFQIDVPGTGIAFIVPVSSIGGKRELLFLLENQNFEKGEETTLKDTAHELLVVIANQGYNEMVMDAARSAGAAGGTEFSRKIWPRWWSSRVADRNTLSLPTWSKCSRKKAAYSFPCSADS